MKRRCIRWGISLRLLLFVSVIIVVSACSKPTATSPTFPFTGKWTGQYTDYTLIDKLTNKPLTVELTVNINDDGIAEAHGERAVDGYLDKISMDLIVLPDGSVFGEGIYSLHYGGSEVIEATGEVIGQLDKNSATGSGVLGVTISGLPVHFPWEMEREP